ncbi:hypothetical protein SCUCBS95973_009616 [Sporothrix curviconia]|uniref:Phospholipid-binding protein n=1 Tax=Sporothrix curviconia TaxID=1260050 RepID=A0ABP0CZY5_9PEZI
MAPSPTSSTAAGPFSASLYSATRSPGPRDDETPAAYSSGYSSFPSAVQSPPTTASTMRPSLSGLVTPSNAPPPRQPIPFSHDDTDTSRLAYETLSASAKAYRVALGQLSAAASNFGSALEACARLKEARAQPYPPGPYTHGGGNGGGGLLGISDAGIGGGGGVGLLSSGTSMHEASCTADVLLATSGLYYLIANQQGILAETVYRSFELPIVHELDRYSADVEAEQESYASSMREASREIRRLEKEGHKLRKPRQRDVGRMRSHLVAMTDALDALTARQGEHAVALLDQSRDMSGTVSQASRNLVRAEVDILDSLARKGWPGGGLDMVLDGAVDLFSRDGFDDDDDAGGLGGSILLGGTTNGAGIVGNHAVVSGAGGILGSGVGDRGFGPRPLLAGNDGGVTLSSASIDDDLVDGDADDDDGGDDDDAGDEGAEIDDDESEVSTINGNKGNNGSSSHTVTKESTPPPSNGGGGGFFSMLTGGGILGRKAEPRVQTPDQDRAESVSSRRGRSPRKDQRSSTRSQMSQVSRVSRRSRRSQRSQQSQQPQQPQEHGATQEAEGEGLVDVSQNTTTSAEAAAEPPAVTPQSSSQQRYTRADSLSIDPAGYQHQYQSLDSFANVEAALVAGSDTASTHTARGVSTSRRKAAAQKGKAANSNSKSPAASSRGRSRPFSPQRVSVDPQEDLFTGQFSSPERTMSLAWLKEGEQLETPQEENANADGAASQGREDDHSSNTGDDKGKSKAGSSEPSPTAATTRESSTKQSPEVRHEETDEGVYIWRQEG